MARLLTLTLRARFPRFIIPPPLLTHPLKLRQLLLLLRRQMVQVAREPGRAGRLGRRGGGIVVVRRCILLTLVVVQTLDVGFGLLGPVRLGAGVGFAGGGPPEAHCRCLFICFSWPDLIGSDPS